MAQSGKIHKPMSEEPINLAVRLAAAHGHQGPLASIINGPFDCGRILPREQTSKLVFLLCCKQ